ncbi:MAG TPA: hypothetical protein PLW27_06530 [Kiritimatiellia bacterium]|nr:hypothetical protein [Kiritimatiellia bacterium]
MTLHPFTVKWEANLFAVADAYHRQQPNYQGFIENFVWYFGLRTCFSVWNRHCKSTALPDRRPIMAQVERVFLRSARLNGSVLGFPFGQSDMFIRIPDIP